MLKEGVSIIICCYNSSLRIEKTLQHIAEQIINDINCEVILVDNASTDNTADIATQIWAKMPVNTIDFNVIYEQTPGVGYARQNGTNTAKFEFLIFCDDDNWLDKYYIQNVYTLFKSNSEVAILGGQGIPEFESPQLKPAWFEEFHESYAVGTQGDKECIVNSVFGAGMAARTSVLKDITHNFPFFLNSRTKNQLTSGEDSEISVRMLLAGHKIMYSPKLTFKHFLTDKRLTWGYLKRLHVGFAETNVVLKLYEIALASNSLKLPPFYWLKRAFYYWGIYFKYWPKHYAAYKNKEGTVEEIHHLMWKVIAINYLRYNFKTATIYQQIIAFRNAKN